MTRYSGSKRILHAVVPVVVLLLTASLWAADAASSKRRGSLELPYAATVAGTQLSNGKYRVEWTGTGDQVEVKIYRGDKALVSTNARLVKDDKPYDCVSYTAGENGAKVLSQISFGKEKYTLRFENGPASSSAEQAAK